MDRDSRRVPDPDALLVVERDLAAWHRAHAGAPGEEVHDDPDVVWRLSSASAWSNTAALVRLTPRSARRRLRTLHARYEAHGIGFGLWHSAFTTPVTVTQELSGLGLRCRKRFPAMVCSPEALLPVPSPPCRIEPVDDVACYARHGHPGVGPLTTPRRRASVALTSFLLSRRVPHAWHVVAFDGDLPVGCTTGHVADGIAGLYDVAVRPSHQRRGIGRALVHRACALAFDRGAACVVLVASGEGEGMYPRVGFREVGRLAFWYKSFQGRR